MKKLLPLVIAVAAATTLLSACGGGGGGVNPTTVATTNTTAPIAAANVGAVVGQSFAFTGGVPAFGTTSDTTLALNSASSFAISSAEGSASGDLSFGSCIFKITTSTFPAAHPLANGKTLEITPCALNIPTAGVSTAGDGVRLSVTLQIGAKLSVAKTFTVDVLDDGTVVVNGTVVGKAPTGSGTGATGASN